MVSYGNSADAQTLAFGAPNTSLDTKTADARDVATSMINSKLNISTDIAAPSDAVTRCCNLLAAGILNPDPNKDLWKKGMEMLDLLRGDDAGDAPWRISIPVERFRGLVSAEEIRPHDFVN